MAKLSLAAARTICEESMQEGRRRGFAPLCVAVLDAGGHLLALHRDERASIHRPQIAIAKASGCLGMGFGGREIARRAQSAPAFFAALAAVFPNGIVAVPGGALIRDEEGEIAGAAAISGDASDNDEICVVAGIAAAGFRPDVGNPGG